MTIRYGMTNDVRGVMPLLEQYVAQLTRTHISTAFGCTPDGILMATPDITGQPMEQWHYWGTLYVEIGAYRVYRMRRLTVVSIVGCFNPFDETQFTLAYGEMCQTTYGGLCDARGGPSFVNVSLPGSVHIVSDTLSVLDDTYNIGELAIISIAMPQVNNYRPNENSEIALYAHAMSAPDIFDVQEAWAAFASEYCLEDDMQMGDIEPTGTSPDRGPSDELFDWE